MKYVKGDLFDLAEQGNFDIVVHGCNCQNTMGSGVAKQVRERYPKAYMVDQLTQRGDINKLGKFTQAHINGSMWTGYKDRSFNFTIINAYTQYRYGYDGQAYASLSNLSNVFWQIKLLYDMNPQAPCRIGIPKIGCDRGGLAWGEVEELIDQIGFSDITCVEYNG